MEELTLRDVIDAINTSTTTIERRLEGLEKDVAILKTDVAGIKESMATKDDLTELRHDLTAELRKQSHRTELLVDHLVEKEVIDKRAALKILT